MRDEGEEFMRDEFREWLKTLKFDVFYSVGDQEWVAIAAGFNSLSWLDETPERALLGLCNLLEQDKELWKGQRDS